MDIGAFVQENRRWLFGVAIGSLVFWIGMAVIGSTFDPRAEGTGIRNLTRSQPAKMYTAAQVDELLDEQEALLAERERLERMLAFQRGDGFRVKAGAVAQDVLFEVGRNLKQAVLTGADERDVEVSPKEISWPVASGLDEIDRVLFGLELIDEVRRRLFAAHDAVLAADEEARGLRSILQLRTEQRKTSRRPFRRGRRNEPDLRDLLEQERVNFKFEADAAVVVRFLEACRQPGRSLVIEQIRLQQPERIADPVVVTGTVLGIAFKPQKESS